TRPRVTKWPTSPPSAIAPSGDAAARRATETSVRGKSRRGLSARWRCAPRPATWPGRDRSRAKFSGTPVAAVPRETSRATFPRASSSEQRARSLPERLGAASTMIDASKGHGDGEIWQDGGEEGREDHARAQAGQTSL